MKILSNNNICWVKHHFPYIYRMNAPRNERTFCQNKRFSCYIIVKTFVNRDVFYVIST